MVWLTITWSQAKKHMADEQSWRTPLLEAHHCATPELNPSCHYTRPFTSRNFFVCQTPFSSGPSADGP